MSAEINYLTYDPALELLSKSLNVDDPKTQEDFDELQDKHDELLEKIELLEEIELLESDLQDFTSELAAKNTGLEDAIEWLKTKRTHNIEVNMIDIEEVISELEAVQAMRGED